MFHLRDGFYVDRDGDEIVIRHDTQAVHAAREIRVSVNEWASVMASTSARGETGETWREAVEYLDRAPGPKEET